MHAISRRYALPAVILLLLGAAMPIIRLMADLPQAVTEVTARDLRVVLRVENTTLRISFLVAIITTALATTIALLIRDMSSRAQRTILFLSLLPVGVNIAFRVYGVQAVIQLLSSMPGCAALSNLLFTETATIIGLIHWLYPVSLMMIYPAVARFDQSLIDAARLSGASWITILIRIMIPVLTAPLSRTFMITFVLAYGAFITPAALGGPGDITVSRLIGNLLSEGRSRSAVIPALVGITTPIICVSLLIAALRIFRPEKTGVSA